LKAGPWRTTLHNLVELAEAVEHDLPLLTEMIDFGAVDAGQGILDAIRRLPELMGRRKVRVDDVASDLVSRGLAASGV
jgi:hypothetical protein